MNAKQLQRIPYVVRPGAIAERPVTAHLSALDARIGALQLRALAHVAPVADVADLLLRIAEALDGAR